MGNLVALPDTDSEVAHHLGQLERAGGAPPALAPVVITTVAAVAR